MLLEKNRELDILIPNMDVRIDDRQPTAIDDIGSEDCEVVSVNLKRKRKLKPETFEEEPKRPQLESNCSSQFGGDASNIKISENFKTKFQKSDNGFSKSDDVQTEVKCGRIKTDGISSDHNYACLATNCKFVDVKLASSVNTKTEPTSSDPYDSGSGYCVSDTVQCELIKSVEHNSNAVTSVKSDSEVPVNRILCCTLSEMEPRAPSFDNNAPVVSHENPKFPNSSFSFKVCENFPLDYESPTCHKQEKPSSEVDVIQEQVHSYQEDESYCETNCESNVLSIEPILEEETLALGVGNTVLDVGNPVLEIKGHTAPGIVPTGLPLHSSNETAARHDSVNPEKVVESQRSNSPQKQFGEFYKCATCAGLFKTLEDFSGHENSMSHCKSFSRRLSKIAMSWDALSPLNGVQSVWHACASCKRYFISASDLDDHYATHYTGGDHFSCLVCGVKFAQYSHLVHHKRTRGHGSVIQVCDICQQGFHHEENLMKHLKIHSEGKVHTCTICEQRFNEIERLRSHMSVHEGSVYYGQKYFVPLKITKHVKIHAESNLPYACTLCGMNFVSLSSVRRHVQQHGDPSYDSYSCDFCGEEKMTEGICKRRCSIRK